MLAFSNIKINLGLNILSKRPDGYHNIESIFYPVKSYFDAIEILPASKFKLSVEGRQIPGKIQDNIIFKAYELIKNDYQIPEIEIILLKNIALGAGLGGGSSNGTFVLTMLNEYFDLKIPFSMLMEYALKLGSDCPFFLYNKPMLAEGRGELLEEYPLDLENYHFLIVSPGTAVSTREAYASVVPAKPAFPIKEIANIPIAGWKDFLINDFEKFIALKYPDIISLKKKLYSGGALFASVSGSGSSVFGIFENPPAISGFPADCQIWSGKPGN